MARVAIGRLMATAFGRHMSAAIANSAGRTHFPRSLTRLRRHPRPQGPPRPHLEANDTQVGLADGHCARLIARVAAAWDKRGSGAN